MLEETRAEADSQRNTDLLTHVVHADSCDYVFCGRAVVEADELGGEDDAAEEAKRKGREECFPGA